MPSRHIGLAAATAVLLLVGACTSERTVPPPGPDLDAFLAAWSDLDARSMRARLTEAALTEWSQTELEDFLRGLVEGGDLTAIDVVRAGPVVRRGPTRLAGADDPAPTATAPVEVTYVSTVATDPVTLEASIEVAYDYELDVWLADWSKETALGMNEDADGLAVARHWGPRARIVDRNGRTLAAGSGDRRTYPYGPLAGATIGHVAPRGRAHPGARLVGASGLEDGYEERLAGRPGSSLSLVGRSGDVVEILAEVEPRKASPLRVTLDVDVQRAAAAAFGGTPGGAVVLDPDSGDILAAVSSSEIDPNSYVGVPGIDPFNRALSGLYPPGSSLKVMTAAAALEEKVVTPESELSGPKEYRGVRNFESGDFGTLDFATAVRYSVNTAFAQIAEDLGPDRLTAYAEAFGFNREPGMALEAATSSFPEPADEGDLMWSSIGQAQVLATPLEMATVVATIANEGRRMEPRITPEQDPRGRRVVSRRTADVLTPLLEGVVRSGTGTAAALSGIAVAGKTGTAEVDVGGQRKNHAWFVAFAPAEDPRLAVAVVAEYGGIGGQVAAPLARAILQATLPLVT